jgi:iron complex outermembrane receptor protein
MDDITSRGKRALGRLGRAAGAGAVLFGAGFAVADESAAPADTGRIEDVVVTATRRPESLEKVPVAVTVISGEQADLHLIADAQDLANAVPALDFRTGSSNKDRDIFVRGIGTITTSPGVEPSVSTVVDGVVMARPGQATLDLLDIDRIEVLRGPQGTLFGKNATAGVINVETAEPTVAPHAYVDAAYLGGGGEYRVKGGVSGEVIPGLLSALVSGVVSGDGGNVKNVTDGNTLNGYVHNGVRAKLLFTPTDDLRITLAADYLFSRDTVPNGVFVSSSQASYPTGAVTNSAGIASSLARSGIVPSSNNMTVANSADSSTRDYNGGASATVDWALGDYTLTSITAFRKWQNIQVQDYDELATLTPTTPAVTDHGYLLFDQTSEEVRLASPKGHLIDYVGGLYFMHAVDNETYGRSLSTVSAAGVETDNYGLSTYGTTGNNYAAFGEATINVTDSLRGIVGLRVVHDDLDFHFHRVSTSPVAVTAIQPGFTASGSTSANDYSDRFGLQYDVTPETNVYATYSRGYLGPAYNVFFNMVASSTIALKPETSNSYEIGAKSRLFDDRLQTNLAGFITDFDNYQANFTDAVAGALVTRLINAGKVSTRGVEADFEARPIDRVTITGSGAWTLARVDQFACPANAASSCDINGEPLPFAPNWKLYGDANYTVPLGTSLKLIADTDYRWQSKVQYALTETPDTIQGAYGIWNGTLSLANAEDGWRVSALVKNILDTHYDSAIGHGNLGGLVRFVPRDNSRYFGVDLRKEF